VGLTVASFHSGRVPGGARPQLSGHRRCRVPLRDRPDGVGPGASDLGRRTWRALALAPAPAV